MRFAYWAAVVGVALFNQTLLAQQRPEALQKLEEYRGALRTGQIEWSQTNFGQNEGWRKGVLFYKTSKIAENARILVNRGDENGIVIRDENGNANSDDCRTPTYRIQTSTGVWEKMDGEMQPMIPATFFEGAVGVPDPRSLGVTSGLELPDIHEAIWRDHRASPAAWRYEEAREGEIHVVRVLKGEDTTTYWIDPRRGWSPVRVRSEYSKDNRWTESRTMLTEMDGVWVPETVQIYDSLHDDGQTPLKVIQVYDASFNKPEHPRELTLADIGVDLGTMVTVVKRDQHPFEGKWDGENVIDPDEFLRRKLQEGPLFKKELSCLKRKQADKAIARLNEDIVGDLDPVALRKSVSRDPKQCESLWEAYTRKFIEKYQLNEEQTQKALAILKDCQDRGKAHLDGHRDEFAKYDELLKNAGPSENPDLQAARNKLLKPLDDIFEQRLVPRLDKLPTRAQRKAAGIGNPNKPDASPKP